MKYLLIIIFIICSNIAHAKRIAIFLYASEEQGNYIYENFTRELGFNRKFNFRNRDYEYHVTLGFIEDIENDDVKIIKEDLRNLLKPLVKDIYFEFGVTSLLGKGTPYIVALPKNADQFLKLNENINSYIIKFEQGKYKLSDFTSQNNYIPHMSLNAKINDNVKISDLNQIFISLNNRIGNYKIKLNRLVIKSE